MKLATRKFGDNVCHREIYNAMRNTITTVWSGITTGDFIRDDIGQKGIYNAMRSCSHFEFAKAVWQNLYKVE